MRAMSGGRAIDWVVMRNRVGSLASRNNAAMDRSLSELAGRIGFRIAPGFTERVIFRELFLQGLTLLDLRTPGVTQRMSSSHIARVRRCANSWWRLACRIRQKQRKIVWILDISGCWTPYKDYGEATDIERR